MNDETMIDQFERQNPGVLDKARFECHHGYEGPCRGYSLIGELRPMRVPCICEDDLLRLDGMRKRRPRRHRTLTEPLVDALVVGLSQPTHRGITV